MITIWHNNRCRLKVMAQLNIKDINEMLRTKEKEYKELDIANKSQNEILELVVQNPKLVERPIIIKDNKACIARPMENLKNLLG